MSIEPTENARPIVVLLGAGASRATCPTGDRNGRKLPVMADLVQTLGLSDVLREAGFADSNVNFEAIYSRLVGKARHESIRATLEERVEAYFADLRLPDQPTVCDHLLLSLRENDYVISFNWDPLLWQAAERTAKIAPLPRIGWLHGNVALGFCTNSHPFAIGASSKACHLCRAVRTPSRILFPVENKNYALDPLIEKSWTLAREALREAVLLVVFGYGAPTTDAAAVELLNDWWKQAATRTLADTEIIDIRPEHELNKLWGPFYHNNHWQVFDSFWNSSIARSPRRTLEVKTRSEIDMEWVEPVTIPRAGSWQELAEFYRPLVDAEQFVSSRSST
jgi:hypothetical protein